MKQVATIAAICVLLAAASPLRAQEVPGCGSLLNAYGPFDYRDPVNKRDNLPVVETFHFTADVEALRRGTSGTVLGDLRYTLRAFPNHHRALRSIAQYALQGGRFPIDDQISSAECYFDRAVAFRPDDETVRAIYGNYLAKRGDLQRAREEYERALQLRPESAEINYVAGLFFLEAGDLERAKALAQVAYASGYPLPGLKNRIEAATLALSKKK